MPKSKNTRKAEQVKKRAQRDQLAFSQLPRSKQRELKSRNPNNPIAAMRAEARQQSEIRHAYAETPAPMSQAVMAAILFGGLR